MKEDRLPNQEQQRSGEHEPEVHSRIYVACLASYNDGELYGDWLDAAQEPESLEAAIARLLAGSPTPGAEEWAIHDYEGFGPLRLGEYESLSTVSVLALGIAEHGSSFAAWASVAGF